LNIFDIIDGIAFSKKSDLLDNIETEKQYSPFLTNRWLSMLDPSAARIINDTVNRYYNVFDNKTTYKFLEAILPEYRRQRINYIKKPKSQDT